MLSGIVALVALGLILQAHCRSYPLTMQDEVMSVAVTSVDTFPSNGPRYSSFYEAPEYLVLKDVPPGMKVWQVKNPHRNGDKIFIADITLTYQVLVYDHSGTLLYTIPLEPQPEAYTDIRYDNKKEEILLGDNLNKRIIVYSQSGALREKRNVGFHFLSFAYSSARDRYIFYLPSHGSAADATTPMPAILVTDASFNPIHQYFPLSERTFKVPLFAGDRFKVGDNEVYYNPDFTDQIYSIDYAGVVKMVVDLNRESPEYWTRIDAIIDQPAFVDKLKPLMNELLIKDFWVTPDYILATGAVTGKINQCIVIDRSTYQSLLINNGILYNNIGPTFNFAFLLPNYIIEKDFAFLFNPEFLQDILSHVPDQPATSHIPRLQKPDTWCLMLYHPNPGTLFPETEKARNTIGLRVFPNPASTLCTVIIGGASGETELKVFSTDGIMRYDKKVRVGASEKIEIDITGWVPGPYIVQCNTTDGVFASTLIVL